MRVCVCLWLGWCMSQASDGFGRLSSRRGPAWAASLAVRPAPCWQKAGAHTCGALEFTRVLCKYVEQLHRQLRGRAPLEEMALAAAARFCRRAAARHSPSRLITAAPFRLMASASGPGTKGESKMGAPTSGSALERSQRSAALPLRPSLRPGRGRPCIWDRCLSLTALSRRSHALPSKRRRTPGHSVRQDPAQGNPLLHGVRG